MNIIDMAGKVNPSGTDDLLVERGETHGNFHEVSRLSQGFKNLMRTGMNWNKMSDSQKEAFDSKAIKMARILSGNSNFPDHWRDDIGYSTLGLEECDGE